MSSPQTDATVGGWGTPGKRVAIVTEVWQPSVNGVVTRLVATIKRLQAAGHEVMVVAPAVDGVGSKGEKVPARVAGALAGVEMRWMPTFSVPFVYGGQPWGWPMPRVTQFLEEFQPDLVHVANPVCLGVAGVIAARRLNLPLVCSYHTDVPAYASNYHLGWMAPLIWKVIKELHRPAAVNVVTSDAAGDQLREIGLGKEQDGYGEIRVWPGGVELAYRAPETPEAEAEAREWHTEGDITAVYVGRIAGEKGLDNLLPLADTPGMSLVLVGDGPAMEETKAKFAGKPVTFTGFLRGQPLVDAYKAADVFVFPSTTDTLGLVLLEALASGLPVVAADAPPSRELLGSNPAARLFPIGRPEAIPGLVKDLLGSMPREELRKKAQETAAGNSWEASTAALVRCYELAEEHTAERSERPPRRGIRGQLARFGLIGALNAIIDLGVFNILVTLFPRPGSAALAAFNTVAVVLALLNSYWWNSRWTFRQLGVNRPEPQPWRARSLFALQGVLNIAINDAVVVGAAGLFHAVGVLPAVLQDNLSKLAAMFTATLISFAAMRWVVFRHHHVPAPSAPSAASAPSPRGVRPEASHSKIARQPTAG